MNWRELGRIDGPGLGDLVAAATSAVGLPPCGGCKERQERLNALTPAPLRRIIAKAAGAPGAGPQASGGSESPTEPPGPA